MQHAGPPTPGASSGNVYDKDVVFKKKHSAASVCLMQTIFAKLGNQKPVHTIRVYARYVCFSTGVVTSVCTFNLADVGG